MLEGIHALLSEADVVVHYNGTSFDIPRLNQEFKKFGLGPPAPYKEVDLFRVVAKKFDLPSRKLDYVVQYFGLGKKVKHAGMEMWIGCMNGVRKFWAMMEKYNKGDVIILEKLYDHVLPWIDNHPNRALFGGKAFSCTNCGSSKVQKRGLERTASVVYVRYHCTKCGKWMRSAKKADGVDTSALRSVKA